MKAADKFTPRWEDKLCRVTNVKGNAIFLQRGKKHFLRTSQHVKKYRTRQTDNNINGTSDTDSYSSTSDSEGYTSDITIPYNESDHNDIDSDIEGTQEPLLSNDNITKPRGTRMIPIKYKDYVPGE